ncbi:MAG: MmgE/PrpD family protein [Thermodesulfobacteriota bacterium]|nr:MmgE/PrpD family protein [Thermodesulfobacteriota bacterium]
MEKEPIELTRQIAQFITKTDASAIPAHIYDHAKVCFLDWLAVTMAGKNEPLVTKLIKYADIMGGNEHATILGHGLKKSVEHAALINGAASHALDYDDSLLAFVGHPSATLFPSLLALSEWKSKSGKDFLAAYIIGLKAGSCIGQCTGFGHYMTGWHGTSTIGHLASAAGSARLLELDMQHTVHALGIAGTQASGLRRVFGTMCKPFHAGKASMAGLMSALLAGEGFTSAEDILEGPNGFFQVMKGQINEEVVGTLGKTWEIENIAQKYHASCHATHSPMEGVLEIVDREKLKPEVIKSIRIQCSQLAIDAAGQLEPSTGLEGKFSIPYCVANAVIRGNTGMQAFTDEKVNEPEVEEFYRRITLKHNKEFTEVEAKVEIEMDSGKVFSGFSNVVKEIPPYELKEKKIKAKFKDLCTPIVGERVTNDLLEHIMYLEMLNDVGDLIRMIPVK